LNKTQIDAKIIDNFVAEVPLKSTGLGSGVIGG